MKFTSQKMLTKPKLSHDRQKALDAAGASERSRPDSRDSYGLVDVLFQTAIQHMPEQARMAVIVFGRNDDKPIGPVHFGGEALVLNRFTGISGGQWQSRDVD